MLHIAQIESPEQFRNYQRLEDEFRSWEAQLMRELGLDPASYAGNSIPETALPSAYSPPFGRLLLASADGQTVGCGGFRKMSSSMGEIKRVYVNPMFRRKGIGQALMEKLIDDAHQIGYSALRLNTASFSTEARALYHRLGFVDIEPYLEVSDAFKAIEVFMELGL